jgi:hypothetical protein
MKVNRVAGALIALAFGALSQAVCQTPDEPAGYTTTIQTNVGSGYNCGRVSSPLYCYGIPVNVGTGSGGNGSFWLDTYVTGSGVGTGFIAFNGVSDLGQATVTSNIPTINNAGQVTSLEVSFNGKTIDGDNGTYTGTMVLTFSYYYSSGGGGRGGAGSGWRFICTGGYLKIKYQ